MILIINLLIIISENDLNSIFFLFFGFFHLFPPINLFCYHIAILFSSQLLRMSEIRRNIWDRRTWDTEKDRKEIREFGGDERKLEDFVFLIKCIKLL